MSTPAVEEAFRALTELQLIDASMRERAWAHEFKDELTADTSPAALLLWLMLRNILSEEDFSARAEAPPNGLSPAQRELREDVIAATAESLIVVKRNLHLRVLEPLRQHGLITQAQYDLAASEEPEHPLASPAAALMWMRLNAYISPSEILTAQERVTGPPSGTESSPARAIFDEYDVLAGQVDKSIRRAFLHQVFPGGPALWISGVLLALIGFVWFLVAPRSPASAPECSESVKTVNGMLFMTQVKVRTGARMAGMEVPASGPPTVTNVSEVGYANRDRTRGCVGTLQIADERTPYAFIIRPATAPASEENQSGFEVIGAEPRVVEARFGKMTPEGEYANQAEPIGREPLGAALRAGVDRLNAESNLERRVRLLRATMGSYRIGSSSDNLAPERTREIAEIEPLGPCKEIAAGTRYACRLLIERNDPMLAALGQTAAAIFEAEYTFERDGAANAWRMSEGFNEEYAQSVLRSREQE